MHKNKKQGEEPQGGWQFFVRTQVFQMTEREDGKTLLLMKHLGVPVSQRLFTKKKKSETTFAITLLFSAHSGGKNKSIIHFTQGAGKALKSILHVVKRTTPKPSKVKVMRVSFPKT